MQNVFVQKTVDYFQRPSAWLLDLLFPIHCIGCRTLSNRYPYLCKHCFASLSVHRASECIGCKQPSLLGYTCNLCQADNAVDQLVIIAPYNQPILEKLVTLYKYHFIPSLVSSLFALTKKYLHQMFNRQRMNILRDNPLLVPVPLSRRRMNWRGFNQAELLAEQLSKTFQISMASEALSRIRHTTPQVQAKDRAIRLENLARAFYCPTPNEVQGRNIILIDDVCTTGTTLNECAKVLKSAGAHRVTALVIARGQ